MTVILRAMTPYTLLEKIRGHMSTVRVVELSAVSGVSPRAIERLRGGSNSPNIDTLEAVYHGLVALKQIRPPKRKPKPVVAE